MSEGKNRPISAGVAFFCVALVFTFVAYEHFRLQSSFKSVEHLKYKAGQKWQLKTGAADEVDYVLVVAVDAHPSGEVLNIVIARTHALDGMPYLLAPISLQSLEPALDKLLESDVDVTEHLLSYEEWKIKAQKGRAGFFKVGVAEVVKIILQVKDGA